MSDDEFMASGGEDEEYDFEYESDDADEPDADLENQYYNAKSHKEDKPLDAIASFEKIVQQEQPKGEWGFKSLKQILKVHFRLKNYHKMMEKYQLLLSYMKVIARNHWERSIDSILEYVSSAHQTDLAQDFYEATLGALQDTKNDRTWFKTNIKLGKMYLDRGEFARLTRILKDLRRSCQSDDGTDDQKKGTQLLEVYALEIQMYTAQKNTKKLKALYEHSLKIKSAIPHPLILGIIRECGGKMHLVEEQWSKAYEDFFEAFKSYDEAGNSKKVTCLKYLVLANMLMKSSVDPFDAQESKPYKNDPQLLAMTNLVSAYQAKDIREFERILATNRQSIMDDPFIREYIQDLLKNIRTEVMIALIRPYTRVRIPFISKELNVPEADVETLLVACILDGTINGHIDQVDRLLILRREPAADRFTALQGWTREIDALYRSIVHKIM